jgi:hypothetical protein
MMKIYLDQSPPASGKTYRAIQSITKKPCKALFITERTDRFDELERDICKAASVCGTDPTIIRVSSKENDYSNTVAQKIESLPEDYKKYGHVIVLATHAAMLRSNFSGFGVWQLIVDEVPQFVDFEEKRTHLDAAFFQKYYRLEPLMDNWSVVTLTKAGQQLTTASVRADDSHKHLGVFHARVIEASRDNPVRFVLCNLPKWEDMSASKVTWCWASTFSLWELEPFDRVVLLGNRFRNDIGNIISETMAVQAIKWEELPPLKRKLEFVRRAVHIHYFSESRRSSRCCFDSDEGQVMLREIGAYLSKVLPADNSIWTANDSSVRANTISPKCAMVEGGLSDKHYLPPRQAGTNNHMGKSHAAMIYSAKPSPHLVALLKMLNVPIELWAASVEHETILQFMSRTSVRDKDNSSPVHLWVFDRDQALYLKEHFDSLDYVSATMQLVADGPSVPAQSKRGPKAAVRTVEEQAEFDAARRRKDAERNRRNRAKKKQVMTMQQAA